MITYLQKRLSSKELKKKPRVTIDLCDDEEVLKLRNGSQADDLRHSDDESLATEASSVDTEDPAEEAIPPKRNHRLSCGKYSVTYLAEDQFSGEPLVVKVLPKSLQTTSYDPLKEVEITSLLQPHPHVVRLLGINHGYLDVSLTLELAKHGDVSDLLDSCSNDRLPKALSRRCFHQVATAVAHLHKRRVAWRDAKPENILVSSEEDTEELKFIIADFGLSEHFPNTTTQPRTTWCCGTPDFASPEVVNHQTPFDAFKADVWSLGVLFFRIRFGKLPNVQTNFLSPRHKLLSWLQSKQVKFPVDADKEERELIGWMLSSNPSDRPSMDDVVASPCFASFV